MDNFYKEWLTKFATHRNNYFHSLNHQEGGNDESSDNEQQLQTQDVPNHPNEIIYENDSFQMVVQKSAFKKQKIFRLQDHLFKFKVVQKDKMAKPPFLSDLFDFFHAALLYILESIKSFYRKEDHNIAYLTLHQEPMVNGLNTGFYLI